MMEKSVGSRLHCFVWVSERISIDHITVLDVSALAFDPSKVMLALSPFAEIVMLRVSD